MSSGLPKDKEKERSPQQQQRPGSSSGHKRSIFGSSSNIFGHRPLPSQTSNKTANEIKNDAPTIQDSKEPTGSKSSGSSKVLEPSAILKSELKESSNEPKPSESKESKEFSEVSKDGVKKSSPHTPNVEQKDNKEVSKDYTSNKGKSSTSFASYLSNVKKRKQEIAHQEKLSKELQEKKGHAASISEAPDVDLNETSTATKYDAKDDEKSATPENKEENESPKAKPATSEALTAVSKVDITAEVSTKRDSGPPTEQQDKATDEDRPRQHQQISTAEAGTEVPKADDLSDEPHTISPHSALSSELSVLPSSSSAERPDQRSVHIPPRIPESDSSDADITRTPKKDRNLSLAEDSDAETVHADSPPKSKRGRLVRKSDLGDADTSGRKSEYDDYDSDTYHKKSILERLERRSQSKSISPQRRSASTAKKSKAGKDSSGRSKLQRACDKGNFDQAKQLIEDGADVNDQDYAGNSPLHEAALRGYTDIVELLLENGAHVDILSGPDDLDTPLIDAASNGHKSTVEILLKYGADPRIQNTQGENAFDSLAEMDEDTPYLKKVLREATLALKARAETRRLRREQNQNNADDGDTNHDESQPHSRNNNKSTSLLSAHRRGPTVDVTDFSKETVLKRASAGDHVYITEYLNHVGKPDQEALALAARFGRTLVINLFSAFGARVDVPDTNGMTPLMLAVGRDNIDTVELLLQAGADPDRKNQDGKSVLDFAKDSLEPQDEEINLIKSYLQKSGRAVSPPTSTAPPTMIYSTVPARPSASATADHKHSETKIKKRKISVKEEQDFHEIKKKKPHHNNNNNSNNKSIERSPDPPLESPKEKEKPKVEKHFREKEKSKTHEIIAKPIESKFSGVKAESMKRSHSNSTLSNDKSSGSKPPTKIAKIEDQPRAETEEEKQARLQKEKEDLEKAKQANELRILREKEKSKEREEFAATIVAKRKARELQFLSTIETEEMKKEEELKKLARVQAEQKLKEAQEIEARAKRAEEQRIIMSQKEEIDRRRLIREHYPYGLRVASFDGKRTKEEVLPYLPLYHVTRGDGGEQFCVDLQVILILGIEGFHKKYPELSGTSINDSEKHLLFNHFYPFLGDFRPKSTLRQIEDKREQYSNFTQLDLKWIKYDEVLKIIKEDFESIYDVVVTRTLEIDFTGRQAATIAATTANPSASSSGFATPRGGSEPVSRKVSSSIPHVSTSKRLPLALRHRPAIVKSLSRNKKLW